MVGSVGWLERTEKVVVVQVFVQLRQNYSKTFDRKDKFDTGR